MRSNPTVQEVLQLLALLLACTCYINVSAYKVGGRTTVIDSPVIKSLRRPLLIVVDPKTKSRIHLVGVSHGSASSAELVKTVMSEIQRPAAVVLELCDDRFWSISLDAKIRPRNNETLAKAFDNKLEVIAAWEEKKRAERTASSGFNSLYNQISNTLRFAGGQGIIGGTFVLLGLFVSSLQRMTRSNTGGDEFVTAMIEAERLNIPVRLGDAPQNDTLNSIKRVMSVEVFNPTKIVQGASLLAFSALGLLPDKSNKPLSKRIPSEIMKASRWVNIPGAYVDNAQMFKSLLPLFVAVFLTTSAGLLPFFQDDIGVDVGAASSLVGDVGTALTLPLQQSAPVWLSYVTSLLHSEIPTGDISAFSTGAIISFIATLGTFLTGDLPPEVEMVTSTIIDAMSILVLIRMAKIIGTDRDCIIAKNIQLAANEFPGQDIVVVIGMLHCNGVARWLLSGADPMTFNTPNTQVDVTA